MLLLPLLAMLLSPAPVERAPGGAALPSPPAPSSVRDAVHEGDAAIEGEPVPRRRLAPLTRPSTERQGVVGEALEQRPPEEAPRASFFGKVIDRVTRAPIEGAVVLLPETGLRDVTDGEGHFRIKGIPIRKHPHEVLIRAEGYRNAYADFLAESGPSAEPNTIELTPDGW